MAETFPTEADAKNFARSKLAEADDVVAGTLNPHLPKRVIGPASTDFGRDIAGGGLPSKRSFATPACQGAVTRRLGDKDFDVVTFRGQAQVNDPGSQ